MKAIPKHKTGFLKRAAVVIAVLAGLILTGFFLSPFFHLGERIAAAISDDGTRYECRSSMLSLPFGLVLERFSVQFGGNPESRLEANPLILRPDLLKLLTGRLGLSIRSEAYGGQLDGQIDFIRYFTSKGPLTSSFRLEEIDLGQCLYLKALAGKAVPGKLTGRIDFTGDSADLLKGSGRALVKIQDGDFQAIGMAAGPGVSSPNFSTAEAEVIFERGTLKIGRLVLDGKNIRCSLKGHVFLNEDPVKSELALNGNLSVAELPDLKLALAVTGTIEKPVFTAM